MILIFILEQDVVQPLAKETKKNDAVKLQRSMGLFSAVNVILAVMIGSGIFISPSSALMYSGSVGMTLVVWALCGVISLLGKCIILSFIRLLRKTVFWVTYNFF